MMFMKVWKTIIQQRKKALLVFDDMTADMEANKKLSIIVPEFSLRERKLYILLVFISRYYFKVLKTVRQTILSWKYQTKGNCYK